MKTNKWIVVQTGPESWIVAHDIRQPEACEYHVAFNKIKSVNVAQQIRRWMQDGKPIPEEWKKYRPEWL